MTVSTDDGGILFCEDCTLRWEGTLTAWADRCPVCAVEAAESAARRAEDRADRIGLLNRAYAGIIRWLGYDADLASPNFPLSQADFDKVEGRKLSREKRSWAAFEIGPPPPNVKVVGVERIDEDMKGAVDADGRALAPRTFLRVEYVTRRGLKLASAITLARVEGARAMLASAVGRLRSRAKFDHDGPEGLWFRAAASEIETMGDDATVNAAIREAGER